MPHLGNIRSLNESVSITREYRYHLPLMHRCTKGESGSNAGSSVTSPGSEGIPRNPPATELYPDIVASINGR